MVIELSPHVHKCFSKKTVEKNLILKLPLTPEMIRSKENEKPLSLLGKFTLKIFYFHVSLYFIVLKPNFLHHMSE